MSIIRYVKDFWDDAAKLTLVYTALSVATLLGGVAPAAVALALGMYCFYSVGMTVGYHRYFSHRSFRTSRVFQFLLAFTAACASQRGVLWWAAHHRGHHRYSDTERDEHSPVVHGLWHAHLGWLSAGTAYDETRVKDWARFPELKWINDNFMLAPALVIVFCFALGSLLGAYAPDLGLTGVRAVAWGYVLPVTVNMHMTFCINSLCHLRGYRSFATGDQSRNNAFVGYFLFGEGWHNNHHRFPFSARYGLAWWEFDAGYLLIRLLAALGLVWDVKTVPAGMIQDLSRRGTASPVVRSSST